jgi:hypothetical protein
MGQLYKCNVRPGGDLIHDVPKTDVSAAEIMVLNHVHGEGAVINIEPTKTTRTPHKQEYNRLGDIYGLKAVQEVFGNVFNVRLPNKLDLDAMEEDDGEPEKELNDKDLQVD